MPSIKILGFSRGGPAGRRLAAATKATKKVISKAGVKKAPATPPARKKVALKKPAAKKAASRAYEDEAGPATWLARQRPPTAPLPARGLTPQLRPSAPAPGGVLFLAGLAPSLMAGTSARVAATVGADAALVKRVHELEKQLQIVVSPTTRGGHRLSGLRGRIAEMPLDALRPDEAAMAQALHALRAAGLRIVRIGRFAITAAGPARLVAAITGRPLALQINRSRSGLVGANRPGSLVSPSDLYVSLGGSGETASGRRFGHGVDDFVFVPPPIYFAPLPIPPAVGYPHLSDTDVRRLLRVPPDLDGTGVTVAMVDTGFQTSHPFYRAAGFDFQAVSTQSAPQADLDPDGHGTAMAWNVLAVAPGVALRGYKETTTAPLDAIEDAAAVADIISCSWGYDHEYSLPFLEAGVRGVVEDLGKIVLFASGNGHRAWPGTMPEIISVGGTHADPDTGALRASDYASGFISSLYRNRRVPDVCGLCGMRPGAVYLPLPVPAGSPQDVLCHGLGQPYGDGDETAPDDGWIYASGTSSATPQVAGVVALMLQKARREGKSLTPVDVKAILERSAQPVIAGTNFFGFPATNPPPSDAVGWGLVDAAAALALI